MVTRLIDLLTIDPYISGCNKITILSQAEFNAMHVWCQSTATS